MTSPSDPVTEINTTFEALQWEFDDDGVCYIADRSSIFIEDFEDGDEIWEMGSTNPYISAGGTTPVMGLVYNDSGGTWALHGNITGNYGDMLRISISHNGSLSEEYTFVVIVPNTPEDPLTSLTIAGRDLSKDDADMDFYLAQGATLEITGWYNDGQDYWFDRNDPEPGHNIYRSSILNSNNQWEGYSFASSGLTNAIPSRTEIFYLTYHSRNPLTGITSTHIWSFYIVADSESEQTGQEYTVGRGEGIDIQTEEQIFMSDLDNVSQYLIYQSNSDYNCVESYTIYGGCEQPFEYVKLKVNRKQLSVLAPDLVDYIIPGRNIITLFGPGRGEYVVTKCTRSSDAWTIIAYAIMEQIRGLVIADSRAFTEQSPLEMIINLVRSTPSTLAVQGSNPLNLVQRVDYLVKLENNTWSNGLNCSFEPGTNVWYAIQVCALRLNAKVWLTDGVLYVVDTTLSPQEAADPNIVYTSLLEGTSPFNDIGTVYLNSEGGFPIKPTEFQSNIISNVVDTPELGEDGSEVLRNAITVTCKDNATVMSNSSGNPEVSRSIFNVKMHTLTIPQISSADALAIANLLANRYCDAETSISFSMAEVVETSESEVDSTSGNTVMVTHYRWYPFFSPLTRAEKIVDYVNESTVSIVSNLDLVTKFYNKGMLSLYESSFPQHITKYTFGISTPTDVSQNNSVIMSAINNG